MDSTGRPLQLDKLLELTSDMEILCSRSRHGLEELRRDVLDKRVADRITQILNTNAALQGVIQSNKEALLQMKQQQQLQQIVAAAAASATMASSTTSASHGHVPHSAGPSQPQYSAGASSYGAGANASSSSAVGSGGASANSSLNTSHSEHVCHICFAALSSKFTLSQHIATHDEGPPKFSCDICGRRYRHQRSVTDHKNKAHNAMK